MLTYCEKNGDRIDLVVVYKVDRLARNVEDHVAIKAALARCGVMLAAAAETFDDWTMPWTGSCSTEPSSKHEVNQWWTQRR